MTQTHNHAQLHERMHAVTPETRELVDLVLDFLANADLNVLLCTVTVWITLIQSDRQARPHYRPKRADNLFSPPLERAL